MSPKKQSYKEAFLKFGFTYIIESSIEKTLEVICSKSLTEESIKPSKLKQHLQSLYNELIEKLAVYFRQNLRL